MEWWIEKVNRGPLGPNLSHGHVLRTFYSIRIYYLRHLLMLPRSALSLPRKRVATQALGVQLSQYSDGIPLAYLP
jgi:hypothetical protein